MVLFIFSNHFIHLFCLATLPYLNRKLFCPTISLFTTTTHAHIKFAYISEMVYRHTEFLKSFWYFLRSYYVALQIRQFDIIYLFSIINNLVLILSITNNLVLLFRIIKNLYISIINNLVLLFSIINNLVCEHYKLFSIIFQH